VQARQFVDERFRIWGPRRLRSCCCGRPLLTTTTTTNGLGCRRGIGLRIRLRIRGCIWDRVLRTAGVAPTGAEQTNGGDLKAEKETISLASHRPMMTDPHHGMSIDRPLDHARQCESAALSISYARGSMRPSSLRQRRLRLRVLVTWVLLFAAQTIGCAYNAENIVRRTTPAAIQETLRALDDPENQKRIRSLIDDAEVKAAIADLAEAMTGGVLDGLGDEERAARLSELSERLVSRLIAAASQGIRDELSPSVQSMVEGTVSRAIERALGPQTQRDAKALAAGVAREAAAAMITSTSRGLQNEIGPALAGIIDDDLGPAIERLLAERLMPALSRSIEHDLGPAIARVLAKTIDRELLKLAENQAVETLSENIAKHVVIGMDRGFKSVNKGVGLSEIIAWVLVAIGLILSIFLVWRTRTLNERLAKQELALKKLSAQIPSVHDHDSDAGHRDSPPPSA